MADDPTDTFDPATGLTREDLRAAARISSGPTSSV